jgi:hypothetical protein
VRPYYKSKFFFIYLKAEERQQLVIEWAKSSLCWLGTKGHSLEVREFNAKTNSADRLVQITPDFDFFIDTGLFSDLRTEVASLDSSNTAFIRVLKALVPVKDWTNSSSPVQFRTDFKKEIEATCDFLRIHRTKGLLSESARNTVIRQHRNDLLKLSKRAEGEGMFSQNCFDFCKSFVNICLF